VTLETFLLSFVGTVNHAAVAREDDIIMATKWLAGRASPPARLQ
jgi:hypothetical protein